MMKLFSVAAVLLSFGGSVWSQSLRKVGTIDLPGPKGQRFDYLTTDEEDHYLLSAHLGPGILYVIDLRTDKLVKAIPGLPGITGLEYVPGLHKVYTSNWGENKIGVVDTKSMRVVKRLPTAAKPNGSVMTPRTQKITSSSNGGWRFGGNRVRVDLCRIRLYVYDRCHAPASPRRPNASIEPATCCGTSTSSPRRSSSWRETAPYHPVKPIGTSNRLSG